MRDWKIDELIWNIFYWISAISYAIFLLLNFFFTNFLYWTNLFYFFFYFSTTLFCNFSHIFFNLNIILDRLCFLTWLEILFTLMAWRLSLLIKFFYILLFFYLHLEMLLKIITNKIPSLLNLIYRICSNYLLMWLHLNLILISYIYLINLLKIYLSRLFLNLILSIHIRIKHLIYWSI
jgi:hypothetical protein